MPAAYRTPIAAAMRRLQEEPHEEGTMTTEELRVYRARQDLGSGAQRAITAGKLYSARETEAGPVIINDLGADHPWPFAEDFTAYFESLGALQAKEEE